MSKIPATKVHDVIGKHMLADGLDPVVDLEKSHGSWIHDAVSGDEYLDLFSCFASMPVGWNHPSVVARKDELGTVAVNKPTNSDIYSMQMADFVDTFNRVAKPEIYEYSFFISGGALAVENALKAAFDWKMLKRKARGQTTDVNLEVIHFKQAFHGRTGYTLSLTNTADPRKTQYFPKFSWPRITNPKISFPLEGENLERVQQLEHQALTEIKEAIADRSGLIAALILEPIQGEGGDNHFRDEFFQELRTICDEEEILMVFDEVQTGVGLTGRFWAYEHFTVHPDLIAFGKKTQVCGFMSTSRIDEVDNNVFHESSRINSTWGGNLTDMIRFKMYLEIIEEEDLLNAAVTQGKYLYDAISELQSRYPDSVSNARGRGLMCAFDLPDTTTRDRLMKSIWKNGALILGSGTNSIRFRPHLTVTSDDIDTGMEIIENALRKV